MKKSNIFYFTLFLTLFFTSCNKNEYMTVIPADATFVTQINLADVAEQSDLKKAPIINLLKGYIGLVASGEDKELVRAVLDDPSIIGIDFSSPAYIFETIDHHWGLVLKVRDEDHLDDTFKALTKQQIASKPTERDGLLWTSLLDDINIAYNSQTLLILTSSAETAPNMLRRQMTQLFNQESELSFFETDKMQKLNMSDAPIAVYSHMAALPQEMSQKLAGFLPKGVRCVDVEMCMSANFKEGEAVLHVSMFSENEKVQQLFEQADEHLYKIRGDYIGAASDSFFAWISVGCQGEWLLNLLKQSEEAKQTLFMLERGIDIEQMLRGIDGDVTFVLPSEPAVDGMRKTDFMALATLKNNDFLADVSDWQRTARDYGIILSNCGKNQYLMRTDDYQLNWGVDNHTLYFATPNAQTQRAFSANATPLADYQDEIKSSQFFTYINLAAVNNSNLSPLEAIVIKSEKTGEWEMRVVGKDKQTNLLSSFLKSFSFDI